MAFMDDIAQGAADAVNAAAGGSWEEQSDEDEGEEDGGLGAAAAAAFGGDTGFGDDTGFGEDPGFGEDNESLGDAVMDGMGELGDGSSEWESEGDSDY